MRDSSNLPIDPLSDLVDFLQPKCDLSGRLIAGGCWGHRFSSLDKVKFNAITEGGCWYYLNDMTQPRYAEAGDVLVTNGRWELNLASEVAFIAGATAAPLPKDESGSYRLGLGNDFAMLGGTVSIDADHRELLLNGLPSVIHVRGVAPEAEPLSWLLAQLVKETEDRGRAGNSIMLSRCAELLFIQSLRAYLAQASAGDDGWLKGFGDPRLSVVLSCLHSEPFRNWGLEELARASSMSRTSLTVRFRELMGVPPLTYLTRWRMQLAKRVLRSGTSVAKAADAVGYSSESAFRAAFKRVMGEAPGQYRTRRGDDLRPDVHYSFRSDPLNG
ncbi:AraC family transcriptional regulator [Pseudomonas sp. NPDC088444]|uniref:AraC family transcriptional regulator n=1 Tax=Pseudomonas sp. NPDC088444 TaxID=3364456 RepID=UPI00384C436F